MAIGTPAGTRRKPGYGCNTYSLGVPYYSEMLLPVGYKTVIDYFLEVANDTRFENPKIFMVEPEEDDSTSWGRPEHPAATDTTENKQDVSEPVHSDIELVTDMVKDATLASLPDEAAQVMGNCIPGNNMAEDVEENA